MTVPAGAAGTAPPGGRLPVVVAPLRSRDLKAVLRIEGDVFDEPWSRQLFESELAQRASRAYRAAWVGRRLGTVLLYDLVRTALARGAAHLTLEVAVGNEPAIALYRRFGLAPVGVRPNYYRDGDALIMWVRDIDSGAYATRLAGIGSTLAETVDLERRD